MTIGLAQTKLDTDLPQARKLITEAHDDAKSALVELRNVVRGIAPTILADRGLDAALSAVVQRTETAGVPTALNVHLPHRLPDEVGRSRTSVAEALTNVAKHARASQAVVTVRGPTDQRAGRLGVRRRGRRRTSATERTPRACADSRNACARPAARSRCPAPSPDPPSSRRCCHAHRDRRGLALLRAVSSGS
jgi:signal transduction histidine kinase